MDENKYAAACAEAMKQCAMRLIDGDHTEERGGMIYHYEVWECPECGATYLYDLANLCERLCVRYACPCGRLYEFNADFQNAEDAMAVMPRLIESQNISES